MPNQEREYREWLVERLKDPRRAASYINAALEEHSLSAFLLALRDVAMAYEMAKVAEATGVQRETIYRMLSEKGNPRLSSLWGLFPNLRLKLSVEPVCDEHQRIGGKMTDQDRQLWQSIRESMAAAMRDSEQRMCPRLPQAEFSLLYGEVNAKCHADIFPVRTGLTSWPPIGQEPDEEKDQ